ncbi:hypothetical protein AJ79_04262 [Helicocarpus griseus UAMH5409]|uniref:Uncharacterized protein n=1 Tax=Helicocarpus griseus UAMH5409 TaxID=1447875 RepID=A0A2B7XTA2_9EURO|nr:hypothetical protein AJ79_04262 [Helicocarpus griseus UAMH5409]
MDDMIINPPTTYETACGPITLTDGYEKHRAMFPPKIEGVQILGSVRDPQHGSHPRKVGCSSMLAGIPYYTFGNVACSKFDGTPVGTVYNAVARALEPFTDPLLTTYVTTDIDGHVYPLLDLTEGEKNLEEETGIKTIITTNGAPVEGRMGSGKGCIWYQKTLRQMKDGLKEHDIYQGTGIAPVKVDGVTGELIGKRILKETLLFEQHEPAFGTFCTARDKEYFYLWGKHGVDIYLARVSVYHPFERPFYRFWNGFAFVPDINMVSPVLTGYAHGVIYPSKLFGHDFHWTFVGNTSWEECTVMMGAAKDPWGPFQIMQIATGDVLKASEHFTGCIYAHPWAFKESVGELLISWSEKWPRGILGAKFQFQMLHQGAFWKDISLAEVETCISNLVKTREELFDMAKAKDVYYELDTKGFGKVTIKLLGGSAQVIEYVAQGICKELAKWSRQAMGMGIEEKKTFKNAFGLAKKLRHKDEN